MKRLLWLGLLMGSWLTVGYLGAMQPPGGGKGQPPGRPGGPGNGPQGGPYFHQIYSASSTDGLRWTKDQHMLIDHASVPCAIVTPEGHIRLYFVDASTAPENTNAAESKDGGRTFTKLNCTIDDLGKGWKALDPSVVRLPDGRYRLYYYRCPGNPDTKTTHAIYSAISDDGIRFKQEGQVFAYEGLVDPDVFQVKDKWLMYVFSLRMPGTIIAESSDGLHFRYSRPLSLRGWGTVAPLRLPDGRFRLYAFNQAGAQEVASFLSTDGIEWIKEPGVRLQAEVGEQITDPYVVKLADGSWKMFYKSDRTRPGRK